MFLLHIHFAWLILLLVALNFIGVNIITGEDRFWLPPIGLWIMLFFCFMLLHQFNTDDQQYQQNLFELTAGRDANHDAVQSHQLEDSAARYSAFTRRMIHLLGVQAILAALSQLWGYKKTGKPYYRSALVTFLLLTFAYLMLALLVI